MRGRWGGCLELEDVADVFKFLFVSAWAERKVSLYI